jgi:hypothetical protein
MLGDYGGATQTIPLLEGSPAIDSYNTGCLGSDQRGVVRPQGAACDIGASEVQIIPTSVTITENDMFTAIETVRAGYPDIGTVVVDFVPDAMNLSIALSSGVVGNVRVELVQAQGFMTFNIATITINGTPGPTSYVSIISRDLPSILTTTLDNLVIARFGSLVDVQTMIIDNNVLVVSTEG